MYREYLENVAAERGWSEETKINILYDFLEDKEEKKFVLFKNKIQKIIEFEDMYGESISI